MPAKIAGVWRGKVVMAGAEHDLKLKLYQTVAHVTGEFELSGTNNIKGRLRCSLLGTQFRCTGYIGQTSAQVLEFDGHVEWDELDGILTVQLPGRHGSRETEVRFSPTARGAFDQGKFRARREPANYVGLWEWTDPVTTRPVRLRLQKQNSSIIATYVDGDKTFPINDFYDFGGGFYFTVRIPWRAELKLHVPSAESVGTSHWHAWLVGYGTIEAGSLKGELGFYPPPAQPLGETTTGERHDWRPSRLE